MVLGTTVGGYRLIDVLGAGGMGEVFRAEDVRLGREVALKVLHDSLASDTDWFARFEREARVLASLNHPNIATLLGFRDLDDRCVIEMELVPGDTLAKRIATGAVPLNELLPIVKQIAQALEAAHDRGVIHRDLKPANIKITPDGRVKVLDFGIAKVLAEGPVLDVANTPTSSGTRRELLLGTPRYMSPEQVRALPLDRRTDIWSFGCVFYEALTARPAFAADSGTDTMAAILRDEPDWAALDHVPAIIQRLIRRCLRKDQQVRLRDIADARIEIEEVLNETAALAFAPGVRSGSRSRGRRTAVVAAAGAGLAALLLAGGWALRPRPAAPRLARVAIALSPGQHLVAGTSMPFALSQDGARLAYVAVRSGAPPQVFLRALDSFDATAVGGTEGATAPFFSPDGEWLGFYAGDALQRVALRGGTPLKVSDAPPVASGAWTPGDTIVFATTLPGDGLWRVPVSGGVPQQLTKPDTSKGDLRHTHPRVLPDGKTVLFTALAADGAYTGLLSLDTGEWKVLREARMTGGGPQFVAPDRLVYAEAGNLVTTPFDPRHTDVRGEQLPLLERVETAEDGTGWFSALPSALVYVPGRTSVPQRTLVMVDREGRTTPLSDVRGAYSHPRFSPDGRFVAVTIDSESGSDVWILDLQRGSRTRVTSIGASRFPTWTADSASIVFQSSRTAAWTLFQQRANGTGAPQPLLTGAPATHDAVMSQIAARMLPGSPPALTGANPQYPASASGSGTLAFTERRTSGERDIWVLDPKTDPAPFLMSPSDESAPVFSRDGHFLAYVSDESGRSEVYVQPYPGPGEKWPVSTDGGTDPVWAPDGSRLYYRAGSQIMAVTIQTAPAFVAGKPQRLFDGAFEFSELHRNFDLSPDGTRFLAIRSQGAEPAAEFRVIFNWLLELREKGQPR